MASLCLADLESHDPHAPGREGAGEHRYLCPLPACADKKATSAHRSLSVNQASGRWRCHRCGERGLLREWWTPRQQPYSKQDRARQALRRTMELPPPAQDTPRDKGGWRACLRGACPLPGTPGAAYLERRALDADFCQEAGVRYCDDFFGRPAVVFPVRGHDGKLVAAQGRYLDGREAIRMRSAGSIGQGVFATPGALEGAPLMIAEAPIDALSLAQCGVPAIALCGKDNRPAWLLSLCAFQTVYAAFDADEAGDGAARQLAGFLAGVGARVRRLRPEGAKDWNALLLRCGAPLLQAELASLMNPEAPSEDAVGEPGDVPVLDALAPYRDLIAAARAGALPACPVDLPFGGRLYDPRAGVLCYASNVAELAAKQGSYWAEGRERNLRLLAFLDAWRRS